MRITQRAAESAEGSPHGLAGDHPRAGQEVLEGEVKIKLVCRDTDANYCLRRWRSSCGSINADFTRRTGGTGGRRRGVLLRSDTDVDDYFRRRWMEQAARRVGAVHADQSMRISQGGQEVQEGSAIEGVSVRTQSRSVDLGKLEEASCRLIAHAMCERGAFDVEDLTQRLIAKGASIDAVLRVTA